MAADEAAMGRVRLVLRALGIDEGQFSRYLEWALSEQLVRDLAGLVGRSEFFDKPTALREFRQLLETRTSRRWSQADLEALEEAVKARLSKHFRRAPDAFELLKLLWNRSHECAYCHKKPPAVTLHIDHVLPVRLGGDSSATNLQFLCAEHNLAKGANREVRPWLDLE
jgi:hypothetical protein